MREVSSAIWTSGEPVSVSCVRCSAIVAAVSGMSVEEPLEIRDGGRLLPAHQRESLSRVAWATAVRHAAPPSGGRSLPTDGDELAARDLRHEVAEAGRLRAEV